MKIGDKIASTKVRPFDIAVVTKADVIIKKNGEKSEIRTKYVAKYEDGSEITFYGFNINKTIFKKDSIDGQLSLFDI